MLIQQAGVETQNKDHALRVPLGEMELTHQGQNSIVSAVIVIKTYFPQIADPY